MSIINTPKEYKFLSSKPDLYRRIHQVDQTDILYDLFLKAIASGYTNLVVELLKSKRTRLHSERHSSTRYYHLQSRNFDLNQSLVESNIDIVNILIRQGFVVYRILDMAIKNGRTNIVELLLSYGDKYIDNINTSLIIAVKHLEVDIVRLLLEHGATADGQALIETFKIQNHRQPQSQSQSQTRIVELLLEYGADANIGNGKALTKACIQNNVESVQLLLKYGAEPYASSSEALIYASQKGYYEIVRLLLDSGAERVERGIDIPTGIGLGIRRVLGNGNFSSALIGASQYGHFDIVQLLLDRGVRANALNSEALIRASEQSHVDIVELLLSSGAKADAQDSKALWVSDSREIRELLLSYGAR